MGSFISPWRVVAPVRSSDEEYWISGVSIPAPLEDSPIDHLWHQVGDILGGVEEVAEWPKGERSEPYTCIDNTYLPDDYEQAALEELRNYDLYSQQHTNHYWDAMVQVVDEFPEAARSWAWREQSHMIKMVSYATGDIEVIAVERLNEPLHIRKKGPREKVDRGQMSAASIASSASRSKRTFTRKVMQIQADTMLTGTIRGAITDRDEFDEIVSRFTKKFQRLFPRAKYAMCAELHRSGGWHWHMAAKFPTKYIPFKRLHAIWHSCITQLPEGYVYEKSETPGNVDVSHTGRYRHRKQSWEPAHLARYIGKYLVKDIANTIDTRANKKRYWSTKGIPHPVAVRFFVTIPEHQLAALTEEIILRLGKKQVKRSAAVHCAAMVGYYTSTF